MPTSGGPHSPRRKVRTAGTLLVQYPRLCWGEHFAIWDARFSSGRSHPVCQQHDRCRCPATGDITAPQTGNTVAGRARDCGRVISGVQLLDVLRPRSHEVSDADRPAASAPKFLGVDGVCPPPA